MTLWTPNLLGADLLSWLDANDDTKITVTGSGVSLWTDKSTFARNAVQTNDASRPAHAAASGYITFSGALNLQLTGYPAQYDVICAGWLWAPADYHTLLYTSGNLQVATDGGGNVGQYSGNYGFKQAGSLTWAPNTGGVLYASISGTANCAMAKDGSAMMSTGSPMPSPTPTSISRDDYGQPFGYLYELIFVTYNSPLATRQLLEGYLAWRWNLQAQLPSNHPYKSAAPIVVVPTGRMKVWNGSAWTVKPVKVWNGSAWVAKPVKVWNGSAWV